MREIASDRSDEVERARAPARVSHCTRYTITGPKEAVLDHCAYLVQEERRPSKKDPKPVRSKPTRLKDADDGEEITITMKQNNWTGD